MSLQRRAGLLAVKLNALVREHVGADAAVGETGVFAAGAALLDGDTAWVLLDGDPGRLLGPALLWARRHGARRLQVLADAGTGTLVRRAVGFALPTDVWHVEGRLLLPAVAEPLIESAAPPPHHDEFVPMILDGGATPAVEFGVLVGEVAGLEVCRVVDDPHLHVTRLEVGVGAHDREAFQMMHGDRPATESLRRVVDAVAAQRRLGAPPHPLNQLGAERRLRWQLTESPHLVGAAAVVSAAPPVPRRNLKDPVPCVAVATFADRTQAVVVCSSGVDLDLVPYAVDARLATGIDRMVLVTPARDQVAATRELVAELRQPVELLAVG